MAIDKSVMLDRLEKFYLEMKEMLSDGGVPLYDDDFVDQVVIDLREEGLWSDKVQVTFNSLVRGGKTKGEAFDLLTRGNQRIKEILSEYVEAVEPPPKKRPPKKRRAA